MESPKLMMQGETLFSYRYKNTLIHNAPSAIKLLAMIGITFTVFLGGTNTRLILSIILCISCITARISLSVLFRSGKILVFYALVMFLFRFTGFQIDKSLSLKNLTESLVYLWQLSLVLFSGTVFFETTSSLEIRNTLQSFQEKMYKLLGNPSFFPDIAFLLSLTIIFIPRIFELWGNLDKSWNARGGNLLSGPEKTWKKMTILVPLLITHLLNLAAETEKAIRNRR